MKKIFPIDWKEIHPGKGSMSTDFYYTGIANRVLKELERAGIDTVFDNRDQLRDAAIRLTAYFEDICSDTGLWGVVNKVCQRRYGRMLPFYDTTEYYPGEPNVQDIKLLLWDVIQSNFDDREFNPENQAIEIAAEAIFDIFDGEYETAPDTDEMTGFLSRPEMETDYWTARRVMEWFTLGSFFSLRAADSFREAVGEVESHYDIMAYNIMLQEVFSGRHNMLSLTAAQWLSLATGWRMDIDDSKMHFRGYTIERRGDVEVVLRDMLTGEDVVVQTESFDENWIHKYLGTAKVLVCNILNFNGKNYQVGAMLTNPEEEFVNEVLSKLREEATMNTNVDFTIEAFEKAAGGSPIVFAKGVDEFVDFQTKKMGSKMSEDVKSEMSDYLRDNTEDGMVAFMGSKRQGLLTISRAIPAIKAPNNPYYNKEYARKNALELMVLPQSIDYEALVRLLDLGYLPDAAMASLQGYEHGRRLVQDNARFIVDYFFCERKD